jgi:hypothetical protein
VIRISDFVENLLLSRNKLYFVIKDKKIMMYKLVIFSQMDGIYTHPCSNFQVLTFKIKIITSPVYQSTTDGKGSSLIFHSAKILLILLILLL